MNAKFLISLEQELLTFRLKIFRNFGIQVVMMEFW